MIGKSYDGTLANGVAATGVDGLTTIVPISAIADWYDYSRMGGIRFNTNYPATASPPRSRTRTASRSARRLAERDERGRRRRDRRHQRLLGRRAYDETSPT